MLTNWDVDFFSNVLFVGGGGGWAMYIYTHNDKAIKPVQWFSL